jgi:hypothetical protein
VARCIVVPEHGGDPVWEVMIKLSDGGFAHIWQLLADEPEEVAYKGRPDIVAFRSESGMRSGWPRNNRGSRLMHASLPVGEWIAGPLVLCGQKPDGGVTDLPAEITISIIEQATLTIHTEKPDA